MSDIPESFLWSVIFFLYKVQLLKVCSLISLLLKDLFFKFIFYHVILLKYLFWYKFEND